MGRKARVNVRLHRQFLINLFISICLSVYLFISLFIYLFRSATGEAWQEIMLDCLNKPEARCDPKSDDKGNNNSIIDWLIQFSIDKIERFKWPN